MAEGIGPPATEQARIFEFKNVKNTMKKLMAAVEYKEAMVVN
jgi:hypothetical protein